VTSGVLLLFLGSDLSARVGELDANLLGALDDFGSFLSNWGVTRELTL
jgi:hypothetical protein